MYNPTLEEAVDFYIRKKKLAPNTVKDLRRIYNLAFRIWRDQPVLEISEKAVLDRVNQLFLDKPSYVVKGRRLIKALQKSVFEENNKFDASEGPPTLGKVIKEYCRVRRLKESTKQAYKANLKLAMKDWQGLSMNDITKEMIVERFNKLSIRAPYQANYIMRSLRALYNFAMNYFFDSRGVALVKENPVLTISHCRLWNETKRRQSIVYRQQMAKWFQGVLQLQYPATRDMVLFLWLTGCRVDEARSLLWENVDLETGVVTFEDTKNGRDHTIPVCSFLLDLLKSRKRMAQSEVVYVFPGKTGEKMCNNYKGYRMMCQKLGVNHKHHDLRRVYTSTCKSLEVPDTTIRYLLNHSQRNDVTAGYMIWEPEDYRATVERVAERLLKLAGYQSSTLGLVLGGTNSVQVLPISGITSIFCSSSISISAADCSRSV